MDFAVAYASAGRGPKLLRCTLPRVVLVNSTSSKEKRRSWSRHSTLRFSSDLFTVNSFAERSSIYTPSSSLQSLLDRYRVPGVRGSSSSPWRDLFISTCQRRCVSVSLGPSLGLATALFFPVSLRRRLQQRRLFRAQAGSTSPLACKNNPGQEIEHAWARGARSSFVLLFYASVNVITL